MKASDPFLLMVAQVYAPKSLAAYMANAHIRLQRQTVLSVKHEAKLPVGE